MKTIVDGLTNQQRYTIKHRDKINANSRAMYSLDSTKRKASSALWKLNNPDAEPNKHLVRKFGITLEDYSIMFETQYGKCAICKQEETIHSRGAEVGMRLAVDHDHATGKIRGLLCFKCNTTLHYFEKNKEVIIDIEDYLRSNS